MDCSPPGSFVHGISQARILEWVSISFSGDLPDPGIEPLSSVSPALAGRFLATLSPGNIQYFSFCIWLISLSIMCSTGSSMLSQIIEFPSFLWLSSVESLSYVPLFATPWTTACQASLSITTSWSLLKLMSIELVMPSNHLILCRPLLLLPSVLPSIRVFSNESVLCIRGQNVGASASASVRPRDSQESSPTPQFKSISSLALSFPYSPTVTSIHDYWKKL